MKRLLAVSGLTLALSASMSGAAVQTAGYKIQWEQPEGLAQATANQYTLRIDTAAPLTVVPTCVFVSASSARCTTPLPTLATGPHTLTLTALNAFGSASSDALIGTPPGKPGNVIITINITIQ